jgi:hypothetical protein
MQIQHRLTPCIWYQRGAEGAVAHWSSATNAAASSTPNDGSRILPAWPARPFELAHVVAPHFTLTVTLAPEDGGTRLAWRQRFGTADLRRALEAICTPANEQNLDRLVAVLADAA